MTGLRTMWGVSLTKVERDFGKDYHRYLVQQAESQIADGLLQYIDDCLHITPKGKFLSDGIAASLFRIS